MVVELMSEVDVRAGFTWLLLIDLFRGDKRLLFLLVRWALLASSTGGRVAAHMTPFRSLFLLLNQNKRLLFFLVKCALLLAGTTGGRVMDSNRRNVAAGIVRLRVRDTMVMMYLLLLKFVCNQK
jgi:hypothetical protein